MVSIISNKLNNILSTHKILQQNNQAGIMGQSTLEPLFVIQHIIEHARIHKHNDLWIIIQTFQNLTIESIFRFSNLH